MRIRAWTIMWAEPLVAAAILFLVVGSGSFLEWVGTLPVVGKMLPFSLSPTATFALAAVCPIIPAILGFWLFFVLLRTGRDWKAHRLREQRRRARLGNGILQDDVAVSRLRGKSGR